MVYSVMIYSCKCNWKILTTQSSNLTVEYDMGGLWSYATSKYFINEKYFASPSYVYVNPGRQ